MHVLIIEGIATSGKSTLTKLLQERFNAQVFSEEQTHEPIMHNKSKAHLSFYHKLLSEIDTQADVVIFDRLYITQAFRAGIDLDVYSEIEQSLLAYKAMTIFLKVDEDAIADRVSKAAEHRDASWGDYIKTKGQTSTEIAEYYIQQQRSQLLLLEQSKLPYRVINTTAHDYEKIADDIDRLIA